MTPALLALAVVLVSALLQGPTLEPLARYLGLATERRPHLQPPIEIGAVATLKLPTLRIPLPGRPRSTVGLVAAPRIGRASCRERVSSVV